MSAVLSWEPGGGGARVSFALFLHGINRICAVVGVFCGIMLNVYLTHWFDVAKHAAAQECEGRRTGCL